MWLDLVENNRAKAITPALNAHNELFKSLQSIRITSRSNIGNAPASVKASDTVTSLWWQIKWSRNLYTHLWPSADHRVSITKQSKTRAQVIQTYFITKWQLTPKLHPLVGIQLMKTKEIWNNNRTTILHQRKLLRHACVLPFCPCASSWPRWRLTWPSSW